MRWHPATDVPITDVTEYWHGVRGSVRLRAREFHHLGPLPGFVRDELAEFGGRHRHRHATQTGEPRFDRGIGGAGVNCIVKLVNNLRRWVLGRADAVPGTRLVTRHKFS